MESYAIEREAERAPEGERRDGIVDASVSRASPGGMRVSTDDGRATFDVVTRRLPQGAAMMFDATMEGE